MPSRARIQISGIVQGVGFRPFVYRLARDLELAGWVNNNPRGVTIELEGAEEKVEQFLARLPQEKPALSVIQSVETSYLDSVGYKGFEVRESETAGGKSAWILPDVATCPACLEEVLDPDDRRYRYPFTNCTHCGPRFSIVRELPYDRGNTTMGSFVMCPLCQGEYDDPNDRRFHAQPNACSTCGPQMALWSREGEVQEVGNEALLAVGEAIRKGKIVALKGLGGFHLICDGRSSEAVRTLRKRKHREEKPLALMFPTLEAIRECCEVYDVEERLLLSPASPIVLLKRKGKGVIAKEIAPKNPYLGVMLPYTPLHHLLLRDLSFPIVATSGNRSDEPICTDETEAVERLGDIADFFLVHDRPIARHVDDSIVRTMAGREMVMRRARGYAPMPISLSEEVPSLVAVGAHLKNTIAFSRGSDLFLSQHIGDLENREAMNAFDAILLDFPTLYDLSPIAVATDLHPDYSSSKRGQELGVPVVEVQHHFAHIRSCMVENDLAGQVLGVAWDGVGLGTDRTLWGGEFLLAKEGSYKRLGHFRTFPLPGGERSVREPRRVALGLLFELLGEELFERTDLLPVQAFSSKELTTLKVVLERKLNAPMTSGVGRLFDAVSSILGICQKSRFEGQGAMNLEFALENVRTERCYPFEYTDDGSESIVVDWQKVVRALLQDQKEGLSVGEISMAFHNGLAESVVEMARRGGEERVALSGGCFQNRYLTERIIGRLAEEGFRCYWHQRVPPNDGGIALGQLAVAAEVLKRS